MTQPIPKPASCCNRSQESDGGSLRAGGRGRDLAHGDVTHDGFAHHGGAPAGGLGDHSRDGGRSRWRFSFENRREAERSGNEAKQAECELERGPALFLSPAHGTICREQSAISPAIKARAEPAFGRSDEAGDFRFGQCREVIDVSVASAAVPDAFVTLHVLPSGMAGRGDPNGIENGCRVHDILDTGSEKKFRAT